MTINYMTAKGFLKDSERTLLFELARRVPKAGLILNIGIEYGASLACLMAGVLYAGAGVKVIGIDIDCSKVLEAGYGAEIREQDSQEAVKHWSKSLDLIFVDGDHGKTGVLSDAKFAAWLKPGGYILFQDCWDWDNPGQVHPLCDGVNAAVSDWFFEHTTDYKELESVGTTRVFKRI